MPHSSSTHAVVDVVADAIGIGIRRAVTAAYAKASAGFRRSRSLLLGCQNIRTRRWRQDRVADAALVVRARTVVDIVADAIGIGIGRAVAAAYAKGVELVSVAVAVSFWDVRTSALVAPGPLQMPHSSSAHAVVDIVADAIGIGVRCAVTATHAKRVELVSVAVAVSFWDVRTSALVDGARTVADATRRSAHTVVDIVADAIGIGSAAQSPPHTPKASSWFPSQSQSPAGMSEHPHS